jgi:hypothetical protein
MVDRVSADIQVFINRRHAKWVAQWPHPVQFGQEALKVRGAWSETDNGGG